jgi:hypothetical protein
MGSTDALAGITFNKVPTGDYNIHAHSLVIIAIFPPPPVFTGTARTR